MKGFNCKRILICNFNTQQQLFQRYFACIYSLLLNHLPQNWVKETLNSNLEQVTPKDLVQKLSEDKANVAICLARAAMIESSLLNQQNGIRAAVVHNHYIAKMCRQHNDANVCVIATDCIGQKLGAELVLQYLRSGFDGEKLMEEFQGKYLKQSMNK